MTDISTIYSLIKDANKIAIFSHISPDGDALGSSLGFSIAIKKLGKTADIYLQDEVPCTYMFLPKSETVLKKSCESMNTNYDLAIALDAGDLERLGDCKELFLNTKTRINIDHHVTNTNFADYNYIEPHASSTGEIIYKIIKETSMNIDKNIAECLYVAIATDTGGFRYSNTSTFCMQAAAELINYKIDVSDISRRIFDMTSLTKVKLMGIAIDSLEIHGDGKIGLMVISNADMRRLKACNDDLDGIINIARNIIGIEAAALFIEKEIGKIKVNFRSNSYVDVAAIAKKFNGGGHIRAAGGTIEGKTIDEAKKLVLQELLKNV